MRRLWMSLLPSILLLGGVSDPTIGAVAQEASPTGGPGASPSAPTGAGDDDPRLYEAVLPADRAAVVTETAGRLSRYRIEATIAVEPEALPDSPGAASAVAPDGVSAAPLATVTGRLDLRFVNGTEAAASEIYFRLYPNDGRYGPGGMVLGEVTVDGRPVAPALSVDETVARLPLAAPLAAGAAVEVGMDFAARVAATSEPLASLFDVDPNAGTITLLHWYPMVAGNDPVTGPVLDPVSRNGDLVFADAALYDVAVTAPSDMVLVTSGRQTAEATIGAGMRRAYVTGPARDFSIVADDDFASVGQEVEGTTVTSYYNPDNATAGAEVLRTGAAALALYNDLFGPYPYAELDLVEGAGRGVGVEFSQIAIIPPDFYPNGAAVGLGLDALHDVTAHEVAHQWWFLLVGNNNYAHAFIDEGLTQHTTGVFFEREYGAAAGADYFGFLVEIYPLATAELGEAVVDQPTDAFADQDRYGFFVYGKGALGFRAVRAEIGDDAYFAGLRDYVATHRFGVAQPEDLRAAFERAADRDVGALWRAWFETAAPPPRFGDASATPAPD